MTCDANGCDRPGPRGGPCSACRNRARRAHAAEHINELRRANYAANPEPRKAATARHREHNLEAVRARERAKSVRQRAEHGAEQRGRVRAANARWKAEHPVEWSLRNREQVRRRKIADADPLDYAAVLARDGMTCHLCGGAIASLDELEFDHVTPTSRGGEHTEDNVRPSHRSCNRRKKDRLLSA